MLDLTKSAKRFLAVNLIDDTSLMLRMPTKRVFDALVNLKDKLNTIQMDDLQTIDEVYELLSVILSNNLNHIKISVDYLSEIIDFEDLTILYTSYLEFVRGVTGDPNSKSPQSPESSQTSNIDA